ncbi:MAG: glycosyltransferase family 2 protein [Actinomycetota bacterium]
MTERLSIVMPAWNEEAMIASLLDTLEHELGGRFESAEIVVVDDASTDRTAEVLAELARSSGRLRVLRGERNLGHGPSVLRGLRAATGEWIFQLDSDGQFVIAEFWDLWARHEEADLVLGVRVDRKDPRHRLLLSRVVAAVVSLLAGRRLRDPNVPFRLFRRALLDDIESLLAEDALAPSILMTLAAAVRGWQIVEVPVSHLANERRASHLHSGQIIRFSLRGLRELLRFRLALAHAPARAEA